MPHQKHQRIESLEPLSKEEILSNEKEKIKSAIITDFILSIEIIIIALSAVADQTLIVQIMAVSFVALLATVGVYGIVALLIRMDDFGYTLISTSKGSGILTHIGKFLIRALPKVIKSLTVIGTLAMLLVAGGIFLHNSHTLHEALHFMPPLVGDLVLGLSIGAVAVILVKLFRRDVY